MKVLIVSSATNGKTSPFIQEQINSLKMLNVDCHVFTIERKGIRGYLKSLPAYRRRIRSIKPDIIHAHYGLSGLFSNFQRRIPVVTTYHGSDINLEKNRKFSRWSVWLSSANIYVTDHLRFLVSDTDGYEIPCGVDTRIFSPIDKQKAKQLLGWNTKEKFALFSSSFDNSIKNSALALEAIRTYNSQHSDDIQLIELKNMSREQVAIAINASEFVLLTSHSEGSPQIIKEALACNSSVVSTNVGAVEQMISQLDGCFIVNDSIASVASGIQKAVAFNSRVKSTKGRDRIKLLNLSLENTAQQILRLYNDLITNKNVQL